MNDDTISRENVDNEVVFMTPPLSNNKYEAKDEKARRQNLFDQEKLASKNAVDVRRAYNPKFSSQASLVIYKILITSNIVS